MPPGAALQAAATRSRRARGCGIMPARSGVAQRDVIAPARGAGAPAPAPIRQPGGQLSSEGDGSVRRASSNLVERRHTILKLFDEIAPYGYDAPTVADPSQTYLDALRHAVQTLAATVDNPF